MQAVTITQITPFELEGLIENSLLKILNANKPDTSIDNPDQLLTIQQAAELLSLSTATIYGLVSRSEIPVSKKGKRLYFSKQELTDWVKAGRKKTMAETSAEADRHITKRL